LGAVNHVPSNGGVNLIRYSLNHEKKLVTNYVEVGYPLKVVALLHDPTSIIFGFSQKNLIFLG
ncbi:MAG: hypothetical protein C4B59_15845, partial [Candidatus Methanogaster sp.]